MEIPYIKSEDADTIKLLVDVEANMNAFRDMGMVSCPTGEYHEDCSDMCNISTFTIGHQMNPFCYEGQLTVNEGVFGMMGNHTWITIDGMIVDGALAQFIEDADPLAIIDESWEEYSPVRTYTFEEWVDSSPNVEKEGWR